jgi:glyoxylase-like metal-dependent hydrolase (beta-lactamase superfamily II)
MTAPAANGAADELYLRQLLAGRDFAGDDESAAAMRNFVYAVGSLRTRECVLVDPAWDVQGLVDRVAMDGMKVVGALATHYHPDHVGGDLWGLEVEGVARFLELVKGKVHVHADEVQGVRQVTGAAASDLVVQRGGDRLALGGVEVTFLHTPGHTPGSQCFLVGGDRLIAGDTLFVQGCGRVDLPGGDPDEMYRTLSQRLATLPDATVLYPGHHYCPAETSTLGEERATSFCLKVPSLAAWRRLMG